MRMVKLRCPLCGFIEDVHLEDYVLHMQAGFLFHCPNCPTVTLDFVELFEGSDQVRLAVAGQEGQAGAFDPSDPIQKEIALKNGWRELALHLGGVLMSAKKKNTKDWMNFVFKDVIPEANRCIQALEAGDPFGGVADE